MPRATSVSASSPPRSPPGAISVFRCGNGTALAVNFGSADAPDPPNQPLPALHHPPGGEGVTCILTAGSVITNASELFALYNLSPDPAPAPPPGLSVSAALAPHAYASSSLEEEVRMSLETQGLPDLEEQEADSGLRDFVDPPACSQPAPHLPAGGSPIAPLRLDTAPVPQRAARLDALLSSSGPSTPRSPLGSLQGSPSPRLGKTPSWSSEGCSCPLAALICAMYRACNGDALLLLSELQGSFAFVLYDAERKALVAARDGGGRQPLYYDLDGEGGTALASDPLQLPARVGLVHWELLPAGHVLFGRPPRLEQFALSLDELSRRAAFEDALDEELLFGREG
ncbi:hypothetical protein H632_c327p0 [Helicosporidium sp. ATCC 50920]|nr:hypothetical protein H632_c327p0 [Helicosporidium sp. ATCC 50920]|eukprot:KDD76174.1 hypothetical protein H632_c327p0 [Helicosporidium sp. ATCC 50920]